MLSFLGITKIDDLFSKIPQEFRIENFHLPEQMEEKDVELHIRKILSKNLTFFDMKTFLPMVKPHYIPPAVDEIVGRQEFYTSYTPYQAEASQGILQALFEYQTLVSELTGMDVVNASMYDSATALGEAALMAYRITKKKKILIPHALFSHKKKVLENYVKGADINIIEIDYDDSGRTLLNSDEKDVGAIYIENPNFFGVIDKRYSEIQELRDRLNAMLIVGVDPLYLSIYKPPSEYDADIVIGEGYLGNPMNFGGPMLGVFGCRKQHLRQMPGRIISATTDREGKRAYCMTHQTREQHIRRGKATSNICSNQALNCIAFLAYVSLLGSNGLQKTALKNKSNAEYMCSTLEKSGFERVFKTEFFNEFVVKSPIEGNIFNEKLLHEDMHGGLPIDEYINNGMLFGVTEMHKKDDIDAFGETATKILEGNQ